MRPLKLQRVTRRRGGGSKPLPVFMGPAYWIPAFWVPALLVTHYVTFVGLTKHWKNNPK